ncbi:serine hydrolase domain-containing protein [Peribacillus sp. FSL R5-0717]|uniref:serine hydrolase domain-containing protein n=1 Tax=Peribacillus sp. FSL R5-0717 TaxID=2975308 RepID=UPI0030FC3F43
MTHTGLSNIDEQFIENTVQTFMNTHHVPGASLALTYQGRLVFARGYGVTNPATNEPVNKGHHFRIASVSKPITAVAIFKLIESGQLQLDTSVFGSNGILEPPMALSNTCPKSRKLQSNISLSTRVAGQVPPIQCLVIST